MHQTLVRAVGHVRFLEAQNASLRHQNANLKQHIRPLTTPSHPTNSFIASHAHTPSPPAPNFGNTPPGDFSHTQTPPLTHTDTHTLTHKHTYIPTHPDRQVHLTHARTHTHTQTQTHTQTHTHHSAYSHAGTHAYTSGYSPTYAHVHPLAHTHAHTHINPITLAVEHGAKVAGSWLEQVFFSFFYPLVLFS